MRIINVTSSIVLDGGSYMLEIYMAERKAPLHLFIPNHRENHNPEPAFAILDDQKAVVQKVARDSRFARQLVRALESASRDTGLSLETKQECAMLRRYITEPGIRDEEVFFPEKWN